jgi:hypothetical protein
MNSYDECKAIVELDLDPIKVKLMHKQSGEGWTLQQANAAEVEYRRFLYLTKMFPDENISPTFDVDIFWHYHILDTMKYAQDCQEIFGYFLHHFPYVGMRGEDDLRAQQDMEARTRALYEETFSKSMRNGELRSRADVTWCSLTAMPAACSIISSTASPFDSNNTAWCSKAAKQTWCSKAAGQAWCSKAGASDFFSTRPRLQQESIAA